MAIRNNKNNRQPSGGRETIRTKKHTIKKSTLINYHKTLSGGKLKSGGVELVRQGDGSWASADGKTTYTGDEIMQAHANKLAKMVPEGQYYSRDAAFWFDHMKSMDSFSGFYGDTKTKTVPTVASPEQISYMVNNIWQPHKVKGYGKDNNAKALKDYLDKNFKSQMAAFYKEHTRQAINVSGEKITIKKNDETKHWKADSTGNPFKSGRKYDRENINEILVFLGLKLP